MRILIAADIFPPQSGGPATYSVMLANELTKTDEVTIVSLNPQSDKTAVSCPIFVVSEKSKILKYWHYFWLLFKQAKDADVIYAMGPVNAGLPAMLAAQFRRKRLVTKVVGDYAWEQGVQRFGVKDNIDYFQTKNNYAWQVWFLRAVERLVVSKSDNVIVPSGYLKGIVMRWGQNGHCVCVVYNTADLKTVCAIEKPANEKRIVSAGRLVPWKGMDVLIRTMSAVIKKHPTAKLKIFGDGPERKNLQNLISSLRLEHIIALQGNLPHQDFLCRLASADLFVLNSGYEGLSHLILEALHSNVPVLASRMGGNGELILSGKNGDLFTLNNKEEISEKIIQILDKNNLNWSETEKQEFFDKFSLESMVKNTREILQNVCKP